MSCWFIVPLAFPTGSFDLLLLVTRCAAALFTMWRGMLGDFDVETLEQPISVAMFVFFQFIVVVLMMNLIIAIMGDSYEMVKENETIEALHERAKIIVDMELLCACSIPHDLLLCHSS